MMRTEEDATQNKSEPAALSLLTRPSSFYHEHSFLHAAKMMITGGLTQSEVEF